jgi:hypothetical protein
MRRRKKTGHTASVHRSERPNDKRRVRKWDRTYLSAFRMSSCRSAYMTTETANSRVSVLNVTSSNFACWLYVAQC